MPRSVGALQSASATNRPQTRTRARTQTTSQNLSSGTAVEVTQTTSQNLSSGTVVEVTPPGMTSATDGRIRVKMAAKIDVKRIMPRYTANHFEIATILKTENGHYKSFESIVNFDIQI